MRNSILIFVFLFCGVPGFLLGQNVMSISGLDSAVKKHRYLPHQYSKVDKKWITVHNLVRSSDLKKRDSLLMDAVKIVQSLLLCIDKKYTDTGQFVVIYQDRLYGNFGRGMMCAIETRKGNILVKDYPGTEGDSYTDRALNERLNQYKLLPNQFIERYIYEDKRIVLVNLVGDDLNRLNRDSLKVASEKQFEDFSKSVVPKISYPNVVIRYQNRYNPLDVINFPYNL